jgi:predicted DNA-binding protein
MSETTTIRVGRETRERINRLAGARGVSAADLIGSLVDRAEDEELFDRHASVHAALRTEHPDLLREIEREDGVWERSDLSAAVDHV